MKVVPIKYTFDMIDDQTLMKMSKSMDSLNSIVLSFSERIKQWSQKLNEFNNKVRDFNMDERKDYLNEISIKQDNLVVKYNNWLIEISKAAQIIDDVKQLLTNGLKPSEINSTSDDISNMEGCCILEKIQIIYNRLNSMAKEIGDNRIDQFKSLPNMSDFVDINNGTAISPDNGTIKPFVYNENIMAYIASVSANGYVICASRLAQILIFKFRIKPQNVKFFIRGVKKGSHKFSSIYDKVKISCSLSTDGGAGDSISTQYIPQNGIVFVYIQGIKDNKVIDKIIKKINELENVSVFLIFDGVDKKENINSITTKNPCLIWNSPYTSMTLKKKPYQDGGYLMNLMISMLSSTSSIEQCANITYQSMFDSLHFKRNNIQKYNLNNFNEALPIFTI